MAERVRTTLTPAQETIEKLRTSRAQAADPLPAPQASEAIVADAATADTTVQPKTIQEAIVAAVARHRAANQATPPAGEAPQEHTD